MCSICAFTGAAATAFSESAMRKARLFMSFSSSEPQNDVDHPPDSFGWLPAVQVGVHRKRRAAGDAPGAVQTQDCRGDEDSVPSGVGDVRSAQNVGRRPLADRLYE